MYNCFSLRGLNSQFKFSDLNCRDIFQDQSQQITKLTERTQSQTLKKNLKST